MSDIVMTRELHKKWTTAMRSGKYRQGTGNLCVLEADGTKAYCCLGVLAEVAGLDLVDTSDRFGGGSVIFGIETGTDEHDEPVYETEHLDGLIEGFPHTVTDGDRHSYYQSNAWVRNDDDGQTFEEIADWLDGWTDLPSESEL